MGGASPRRDRHAPAAPELPRRSEIDAKGRVSNGDKADNNTLPLLTPHLSDELVSRAGGRALATPLSDTWVEDHVATGLSLKAHPVRFFRERLTTLGAMPMRGCGARNCARICA